MHVAACQLDIVWEDPQANFAKVQRILADADLPAKSLFVLPEMFATGFSMNVDAVVEDANLKVTNFLKSTAIEHGIYVIGGLVTRAGEGSSLGRNESVLFAPDGSQMCRYQKIQPFSLGGEGNHYEAGSEVRLCQVEEFSLAMFICYDLRFPEHFRTAFEGKAQVMTVIASWPDKRDQHWVTLLQARAIENQCYMVGVNRCGVDPSLSYSGRSIIVDPLGEIIADAGNAECLIRADLDVDTVDSWRYSFPAWNDRRDPGTVSLVR